ncbi:hypothetical protein LINGRAHAP2_LOCUS6964 [Linum grandiflorum]
MFSMVSSSGLDEEADDVFLHPGLVPGSVCSSLLLVILIGFHLYLYENILFGIVLPVRVGSHLIGSGVALQGLRTAPMRGGIRRKQRRRRRLGY